MAAIFLFLVFRNSGLGPSVLGDEWSYSLYSRLLPFSQAQLPSFLYFLIYRSSNVCGVEFASCARVLNAGFFVTAAPFMFLIARRHMHPGLALLLTLATLLSPLSTYTAFFMPEAMYFFMFWVLAWLVLVMAPHASVINGLMVGALLGAMCLVKLHALFLLGGYCLYLLSMLLLTRGMQMFRVTMQGMATAIAVFFAVRLGGGYLLAGDNGLHLLGSLYGAQVNGSFSHPDLKLLLHHGVHLALGHGMALVMLYAVPLACFFQLRRIPAGHDQSLASDRQRLMVFSMTMLSVLVAVTVYFTANVSDGNPLLGLQRLHMRYYSFALPLLYLVAGAWTKDEAAAGGGGTLRHLAATLVVGGLYIYAWHGHLHGFTPNRIDSPEIYGVLVDHHFFSIMAALGLGCLVLWLISRPLGATLYVLFFVPVFALGASSYVDSEASLRKSPDIYDTSARTVHDLLPSSRRTGVVLFGDNIFGLVQANFQLDSADAKDVVLRPGQAIETENLPADGKWALVIGPHAMKNPTISVQNFGGFALYRLATPLMIDFRKNDPALSAVEGLSGIENFGRWSDADEVVLHVVDPLPASANLLLTAAAYGPNIGKPFIMTLGNEQRTFTLTDVAQTVHIQFHNPAGLDVLRISVPAATSPRALGMSPDDRPLGIALSSLQIKASTQTP
ncbi:MAG TPA: hypothetical protein VIM06_05210 [Rhodanobacter sp.]